MNRDDLQIGFDQMLGITTVIKKRKQPKKSNKKELFLSIFKKYEDMLIKSTNLQMQYDIDLTAYEDPFYSIIDDLILLGFGEEIYKVVSFYLYKRVNQDGTFNSFFDSNGGKVNLSTYNDLFIYLNLKFPETFK